MLLARSFANTKTANAAEKEVTRPYRVRIRRDQAWDANCKTFIDRKFKLFVDDIYWKNRRDNIINLKKYYVSASYFLSSHHDLASLEHVNSTLTCTNKANNWDKSINIFLEILFLA